MLQLLRHPQSPSDPPASVAARADRLGNRLELAFVLDHAPGSIRLPSLAPPVRRDELWRHTCFEAFVRGPGESYVEFNLSPSSEWAAYAFDSYRSGMRPLDVPPPRVETVAHPGRLELTICTDLHGSALDDLHWLIHLSAVLEDAAGDLSYWALRHAPGKPDFHHADCFALELPGIRGA